MTDTKNDTQKLNGILLRKYAQNKGIDLVQLQQQSGLGDAAVQHYWSKDESEIHPNELNVLAQVLDVQPEDLLVYDESSPLRAGKFVSQAGDFDIFDNEQDIPWMEQYGNDGS